jgi:two-component system, OmpR family, alkaline phosphatase synthesis response regulator PhoP
VVKITRITVQYMKKKILLAEDNQFILRSFKHILSEQGYEVETVSDGTYVIAVVCEWKPDILLLDLILPNMNGFDILKELRSNKEYNSLPIIVATSLGQDEDKDKVMNLGATDYIIKSHITSKELVDKIVKVLE